MNLKKALGKSGLLVDENPGSKWPKCKEEPTTVATKWKRLTPFFLCSSFLWPEGSLGCLKDSKRLTLEQLTKLTKICDKFNSKVSGGDLSDFHDRFQDKPESMLPIIKPLRCSKLYLTLYECRSHERVLLNEAVQLKDGGQKLCVIEPEEKNPKRSRHADYVRTCDAV